MRQGLLVIVMVMVPAFLAGTASADTTSVSGQQIKITAIVLPATYVVVNKQNQVQQIISNTFETDTLPTIYQDSVKIENLRALTPDVQQQVTAILKTATVKPGVIYKRTLLQATQAEKKVLPLLMSRK